MRPFPILAVLLFAAAPTRADIPVGRRLINQALYQLNRTPTGARLDALRQERPHLRVFWHFVPDPPAPGQDPGRLAYLRRESGGGLSLRLHSHLRPAWPEYRSWALAMGLARYEEHRLLEEHGASRDALPRFVETERIVMLQAVRHWDELGAPDRKDFALDPRFRGQRNLAVRLKAGAGAFYAEWKRGLASFNRAVDERTRALGRSAVSLDPWLAEPGRTLEERRAGEALKRRWESILADHIRYRGARSREGFRASRPARRLSRSLVPGPMEFSKAVPAMMRLQRIRLEGTGLR